jgi:cyanophycin synthetase
MLDDEGLAKLHTNQRLLVLELQKRGVDVRILSLEEEWLEAECNGHKEFILDRDSSINPYAVSVIAGDKYKTKRLLQRAGISVVKGNQFTHRQMDDALVYAQDLGFPIVVKPVFGSHGYDVNMDLLNLVQVKTAIDSVVESIGRRHFLIEEQFEGKEYRVFITREGDYAVLHRDPSHVIGDGVKTIRKLAEEETAKRDPKKTSLCPIMLDEVVDEYLARRDKDLNYVPQAGEKVYLRHNSNVAHGGTCEDFTDKVHSSVIEVSKKTLDVFHSLPYAGVDFLTKDVFAEQTPDMYRILEVNTVPGFKMHMYPSKGEPRNIAVYVADMMFPETRED